MDAFILIALIGVALLLSELLLPTGGLLAVLDQAGEPGVATQVHDLLALAVGPEEHLPVDHHVEQRGEVRVAVGAVGGHLDLHVRVEELLELLVGQLDRVASCCHQDPSLE